jgi:hypothetical protein
MIVPAAAARFAATRPMAGQLVAGSRPAGVVRGILSGREWRAVNLAGQKFYIFPILTSTFYPQTY